MRAAVCIVAMVAINARAASLIVKVKECFIAKDVSVFVMQFVLWLRKKRRRGSVAIILQFSL